MYYVYILNSFANDWRYVGFTTDLRERFNDHNQGMVDSTRHHRPFKMASYLAVEKKETAINLEKYLKTGSGIAWMNKRLLDQ